MVHHRQKARPKLLGPFKHLAVLEMEDEAR
jgi:hypothetical protein